MQRDAAPGRLTLKLRWHQQGWVLLLLLGQASSLPPPPARACCHAADTRAFVHEKRFGGQASIPTFRTPLRCCRAAAGLQPPLGGTWQLLAVHGNAALLFRVGSKGYCLGLGAEGILGKQEMTARWERASALCRELERNENG